MKHYVPHWIFGSKPTSAIFSNFSTYPTALNLSLASQRPNLDLHSHLPCQIFGWMFRSTNKHWNHCYLVLLAALETLAQSHHLVILIWITISLAIASSKPPCIFSGSHKVWAYKGRVYFVCNTIHMKPHNGFLPLKVCTYVVRLAL